MDIGVQNRDLGAIDVHQLRSAVLAQDDAAWRENVHRQRAYDVHHDTESIVLLFCEERWPDPAVTREAGWARLSDIALPLMNEIIDRSYRPGGIILRAMAAKLKAGKRVVISAHGNSLRALVKHLSHIPDDEITGLEIPTGQPIVYELDDALNATDRYYLSER